MKEALIKSHVEPHEVSEVIVGNVLTAGKGPNTGRQSAVLAGIPFEVPAYTINMLCGSGLK
jgi:acetyl-CoA C-acetyltransferase